MDPTTIRNEMEKTNRIFETEVVGKGDFSALKNVYTKDARILPPGAEMIGGRDQIQTFWQQAAAAMGVNFEPWMQKSSAIRQSRSAGPN